MTDKKTGKRVALISALVIFIAGMWLIKNGKISEQNDLLSITQGSGELNELLSGGDFTLASEGAVDYEELFKYNIPVIVDYGSDECIPCKQMAPVLETLNAEYKGKAFIKFVDVWKYPDGAADVPVQVIPTQILFNADGTSFVPGDELASKIEFSMFSSRETGEHVFTTHQGGITEEDMKLILAEMGAE